MSVLTCENKTVATLHLDRPGQPRTSGIIREDQCLAVGTDPSNDICLLDDDVATTHCMIAARGGNVTVRDCFSAAGTFVDQVRIRELQLQADAIIQIGRTKITVQLNRVSSSLSPVEERLSSNTPPTPVSAPISSVRPPAPTAVSVDVQKQTHASPPTEPLLEKINQLETQLQDAQAEIDVLQSRLTSVPDVAFPVADPYQEEMLELLRAEILALQTALADRDHVQTAQAAADSDFDRDDQLSKPDAEKLVERLEQLLQELQQRDDQIATLTDLLEATEAANRAEQEERSQIDSWLHDIEQRCGDREQEWRAQQAKLQSELEAVAEERNRAQAALNGDSSSVKLEAAQNVMRSLRETAETQREKLNAAEQEISRLRRELEAAVQGPPREERMQLAEERSEIARLRQELEHERQRRQNPAVNDDNLKLKALRQHLNEIHEQEKKEREERKLSSRIARLWNRLDGR
jgi:pSer/pThr/pTyr-binding forkhead associated (FHA) protein